MANPIVFFDISLGGEPLGRMEMELYVDICPITAEIFRALCTGEKGNPLHYKGTSLTVENSTGSILGGQTIGSSIYANFNKENQVKNHQLGALSMFTGSTFIISPNVIPDNYQRDYTVFGQVVTGIDVLNTIRTRLPHQKRQSLQIVGRSIMQRCLTRKRFFSI